MTKSYTEKEVEDEGMKLKECPFCGSSDITLENTWTASYWAECQECEAKVNGKSFQQSEREVADFHKGVLGPSYIRSMHSAERAWNRRRP